MITCESLRNLLPDYLGDELDPAEQDQVREHIASCEPCHAEVATLTATLASLRNLKVPAKPASAPVAGIPVGWPMALAVGARFSRLLAYAAMLMIGVGLGWIARSVLPDWDPKLAENNLPGMAIAGKVHPDWIEGWSGVSPSHTSPSVLARNMAAFSRSISTRASDG